MTVDNTVPPFGENNTTEPFPFQDVSDQVEEVDVAFPFANDTESDYVEIEP